VKVTYDLQEFVEREVVSIEFEKTFRTYRVSNRKYLTLGLCGESTIWCKYRNKPVSHMVTIVHELIHFIIHKYVSENYGSLALFRNLLDGILDFVNGNIRYQQWRRVIYRTFKNYIKIPFKDFMDWELCRNNE
jgi:hypothetical protein